MPSPSGLSSADWLDFCRRAANGARQALARYESAAERAVVTGTGEGGDRTLVIDRAAEDAIFAELEELGTPCTAVSEESGELPIAGGGPAHVVIDPIDGSLNAKRGLPFASVSIAVADGARLGDVEVGYVTELDSPREWWAVRGGGAYADGRRLPPLEPGPLELLGLETVRAERLATAAPAIAELAPQRVRVLGSVAVSLCLVAAGALDAMLSLKQVRSVDVAAGVLIVREAGGSVSFPEAGDNPSLGLDMRSRVLSARDPALLQQIASV